jgi:hypothetical protein
LRHRRFGWQDRLRCRRGRRHARLSGIDIGDPVFSGAVGLPLLKWHQDKLSRVIACRISLNDTVRHRETILRKHSAFAEAIGQQLKTDLDRTIGRNGDGRAGHVEKLLPMPLRDKPWRRSAHAVLARSKATEGVNPVVVGLNRLYGRAGRPA